MDSPTSPQRPPFDLPLFLATVLPALGLILFACLAFQLATRRSPASAVIQQPPKVEAVSRPPSPDKATVTPEPKEISSAGQKPR